MTGDDDDGPAVDPLGHFVVAQAGGVWERALGELRAGTKRSHWMWFVFPQIAGLGRSDIARFYALPDLPAARAYIAHGILGERLRTAVSAVTPFAGKRSAEAIFGAVDAMKLRSSLTLFAAACPAEPLFTAALAGFYGGEQDPLTLARL